MSPSSPQPASGPARVDELDGLRGLLALWVAFSHIFAWSGFWENPLPGRLASSWLVFVGAGPAVETFIILSGFAISFLLHKRVQSYGSFMRGRFFRIYPVYLLCLIIAAGTSLLTPAIIETAGWRGTIYFRWVEQLAAQEASSFWQHVFWHLTLLNGLLTKEFLPGATGTLLVPAWSITLEWQYYLIAPFLARGVRSGAVLVGIGVIAMVGDHYSALWQNPQLSFFPAQLPLFLIGIGSYHLYAKLSDNGGLRPLPSFCAAALLLTGVLSGWYPVALAAWAAGFGCILVKGSDPLARFLALIRRVLLHRQLQYLGKISFPLYLIHWPVIILLLSILLKVRPSISSSGALVVLLVTAIPACLLAAHFIHILIEKPAMDFGRKFDRRPR
jgi:peptidoglycan/LPS O-acetylase OafA/YrhL